MDIKNFLSKSDVSPQEEDQSSREFVREAMDHDDSEPLDGSLTNELAESHVGTVIKEFSSRPKMAFVQMFGRAPSGNIEYQDQQSRIQNEKEFREYAENTDVRVPDILGVEDEYVEFERVDGVDMNTYLNMASVDEAEEAGELVGNFLSDIHDMGGAITDLRINNFMMDYEEGGLAFVDGEYFSSDASDWEQRMDMITMASSAKQVDPEAYESFRDGFEETYGDDIDVYTEAVSSVTAPGHAGVLERESERVGNAVRNSYEDAKNRF